MYLGIQKVNLHSGTTSFSSHSVTSSKSKEVEGRCGRRSTAISVLLRHSFSLFLSQHSGPGGVLRLSVFLSFSFSLVLSENEKAEERRKSMTVRTMRLSNGREEENTEEEKENAGTKGGEEGGIHHGTHRQTESSTERRRRTVEIGVVARGSC